MPGCGCSRHLQDYSVPASVPVEGFQLQLQPLPCIGDSSTLEGTAGPLSQEGSGATILPATVTLDQDGEKLWGGTERSSWFSAFGLNPLPVPNLICE